MRHNSLHTVLCILLALSGCSRKPLTTQDDLDRNFEQMMTGVTLVGRSTRWNKEGLSGEERYTIDKASRLTGDTWLLQTRIKYGSHDVPVPIPVTIKWAGDTPVITLTDLKIPGLGTFTSRVLLYRDQYAGTWSGEGHGGQLFGKIERGR